MEYTEESKQGVRHEFAILRKRQLLVTVPFIVVVFGSIVFANPDTAILFGIPPLVWIPILGVLIIGMALFSFKNWRCPACKKYLGKTFNPKFCQKCGIQLR